MKCFKNVSIFCYLRNKHCNVVQLHILRMYVPILPILNAVFYKNFKIEISKYTLFIS